METTKLLVNTGELLQPDNVPAVIKNKILISPGTWNDIKYSAEELDRAYINTDWSDKANCSLYLDHKDTKNEGVGNWVGYIRNIRTQDKGVIIGDLEIWNPLIALYLSNAKAKFGISATLKGMENKSEGKLTNFRFESFSIVTDPACKECYINLSQEDKKMKGGKMANETEKKVTLQEEETEDETEEEELDESEAVEELAKEDEEDKKKKKKAYKEQAENKKKKYPYPEDKEKCAKKKKYPYPEEEEEMNEDELFEITANSEWTDFVSKMKKKYPDMSFKDIAKSFKSRSKEMEELEQLSDEEVVSRIQLLTNILRRRSIKLEAEKVETPEQKMTKLEQTIKELQSKINEPDRKTLSVSPSQEIQNVDPLKAMADFLQSGGHGSFNI